MFYATAYWILVSVASTVSYYDEDEVSYAGAQVWRTLLNGAEDILLIKKLTDQQDISIWNLSPEKADYLVSAKNKVNVHRQLKIRNLDHTVLILDVQRRVDSFKPEPTLWDEKSLRIGHRLDFKSYPTLKTIDEYFNYLADNYPSLCRLQTIGRTAENRTIQETKIATTLTQSDISDAAKLSNQMLNVSNGNPANKVILITAGIHSREWITITSALFILDDLVTKFDHQPEYIKNKNWFIVPVLNPDGYEFSYTKNRLWRKNRSGSRNCKGVDLNRNFALDWGIAGITVNNPCGETYSGPFPFSEAESIALRYLLQRTTKVPSALVDLHAYGQLLLFPWSARSKPTEYARLHRDAAHAMSLAMANLYGHNYTYGQTYHMIYPATGSLIDWAYSAGVLQSFAIETRDTGSHGFLLPEDYIEDTGRELLAGVRQLAKGLDVVRKGRDASWF